MVSVRWCLNIFENYCIWSSHHSWKKQVFTPNPSYVSIIASAMNFLLPESYKNRRNRLKIELLRLIPMLPNWDLITIWTLQEMDSFFLNVFFFFFLILVDFVIHWNETAMGLHVFPIPIPPLTSLSTRPLGLPSAPGPSTCLMHPTWAGDQFHPR